VYNVYNAGGGTAFFDYKYCSGSYYHVELASHASTSVCVDNNNISSSYFFMQINRTTGSCIATTTTSTTTTTAAPTIKFTAANCQNIYDNNTYQALSSSVYTTGSVFIDAYGTCYYILNFTGETPVGTLTYLAPSGSCGVSPCVTTTTTIAPFCNTWLVTNPFGAGYTFKYKYCGAIDFSYPEVAPYSSMSVCVQNNEIFNAFAAPLTFTNLSSSCVATTTTTTTTLAPTTTTTTTRAPYCSPWTASNAFGAAYTIKYIYCGTSSVTYVDIPANSTRYFCVQSGQIDNLGNPILLTEDSGSCVATTTTTTTTLAPTTTTTTTRAPYCSPWTASNAFGAAYDIQYTYCGATGSTIATIPANSTRYFCVQSGQINNLGNPILLTEDSGSCVATTTTTTTTLAPTTTTTTTLAPFCSVWTASNAFGAAYEIRVKYCGDTTYSFPNIPPFSSIYVCVQNNQIDNNGNPILLTSSSVSCSGSIITTTTTTAAPTTTTTSTTTTTTAGPTTTTTTTTLASQKYYVESCSGPGDIVGVITITNAPLLTSKIIRLNTSVAGLSCFQVYSTSTGTSVLGTRSVTNIYTDCVNCTD
jgi:hypothetical protein